jgi:hypothetical protein
MRAERVEYTDSNHYVWQGVQIAQDSVLLPGHMLLIRDGDEFVGEIAVDYDVFLISSVSSSKQVLIKTKDLPPIGDSYPETPSQSGFCTMGDDKCISDVVIVYTEECLEAYPNMAMLSRLCYEQMNAAFIRSGISQRTKLAGVFQWSGTWGNANAIPEAMNLRAQLENPLSWISQIKYALDADLVVLLTPGILHTSAIGYANEVPATTFEGGSAVVNINYAVTGAYVYTHEVGHLFGGRHQDDPGNIPARAHEFDATFGSTLYHYLTIMHTGVDQILNFSNPDVNYLSVPTGTADRFNACKIQEYGCSVSNILPSDECRVRATAVKNCNDVVVTASLKRDDGSTCSEVVGWEMDYSFDGVNYVSGSLTNNPILTINFPSKPCYDAVFLRIKAYNSSGTAINTGFEWFYRSHTCRCASRDKLPRGDFAYAPLANENLRLAPNPVTNEILINLGTPIEGQVFSGHVYVYSFEGGLVMEQAISTESSVISLNLSDLPKGNYVINLVLPYQSIARKITKT